VKWYTQINWLLLNKAGECRISFTALPFLIMKRVAIIFFLLQSLCIAQVNLVSNWSLEEYVLCPTNAGQLNYAQPWYSPTPNSPDYFNACSSVMNVPNYGGSGYQLAKNGIAYAGIFIWDKNNLNDREYIQTYLTDTLRKNTLYCIGFWINLHDGTRYAADRVGAYLSVNPISDIVFSYLPYTPQVQNDSGVFLSDKLGWTLISGTYQAQGGEKYITIGNFSPDVYTDTLLVNSDIGMANIAYYMVDAVFVYECDSTKLAEAGEDKTICKDSSVRIGAPIQAGCHYKWTPPDGLNNDTLSQPMANPQQTTSYYLVMSDPFYQLTADSVTVFVDNNCLPEEVYIPNIFSPNNDGINDGLYIRGQHIKEAHFTVYNRWGEVVFETVNLTIGWKGQYKNKDCAEGVYFYVAEVTFESGESKVKKGSVSLVR
jgi:gliding motility-associated-like protein